jgi:potassium efflux system protein
MPDSMIQAFLRCLVLPAWLFAVGAAPAPAPSPKPPPAASSAEAGPSVVVSADIEAVRSTLDTAKLRLDQLEAALSRRDLSDAELQELRQQAEPLSQTVRSIVDDLQPRADAAKARLDQLGARPKEGEPEESAAVQRERSERENAMAELGETQRLGRALVVQADQIMTQIGDRRRSGFARSLMQRSAGLLSPELWASVARSLPRDGAALRLLLGDWGDRIERNSTPGVLVLLGLAAGVAIALYVARDRIAPRLAARDPAATELPQLKRLTAALGILVFGALPAAAGSYILYVLLTAASLYPARAGPVVTAVLGGLGLVAFVRALAEAVLAPDRGAWRLVKLGDRPAARTARFAVLLIAVIATGKAVEALNQAIAAALPMTIATKGLFALLAAVVLGELLRRFAVSASTEEECLGPYIPTETEVGGPVRILGWAVVVAVAAGVLTGYVAFAAFLVDQLVWIAIILAVLLLAISVSEEMIAGSLRRQTRVATMLQANTGLRRRSLEQIAVLTSGLTRVALIIIALLLALAPWGVDSADLLSSVQAAFFGFRVGEITISLATVMVAILIFALGFAATRIVQNWLDTTFLPATELDAGLRNSIRTAFGYLGFFAAAALAFGYLGLSLDKIAIVAGALSVGIGFGLQSIVNNFVSGLILLWERPIRVGDLVVVGDGEGIVRKISVRATEIETFDRAMIIVPNSNLISGVVKNRVRMDRTGRVIIAVNVLRNQDPARAAEILATCADQHSDVLKNPPPRVVFKRIGDTWLEFELVCYVSDVNLQQSVQSELNFAVLKALDEEGIMPPLSAPALNVQGLGPVETALDHIAEAIGNVSRETSAGLERRPRKADAAE